MTDLGSLDVDTASGAPTMADTPAARRAPSPVKIADEPAQFDPSGALWLPERGTLIVSDLHLEKGSSFAVRGVYLPPYDSRVTLTRLGALCARLKPDCVVALGDSFHDRGAPARLDEADVDAIRALTGAYEWIWIAGNHDPKPPVSFGGQVAEDLAIGPLVLRHEPSEDGPADGEVAGHLHPVASIRVRGRRVRRRCFVTDGLRVVLPAFGAYAGGLCVLNEAFAPLFPGPFQAFALGKEKVFALSHRTLVPDTMPAGPMHWRV